MVNLILSGFLRYLVYKRKTQIPTKHVEYHVFFGMRLHSTHLGTRCANDTPEKQVSLLGGHLTGTLSCLCDKEHFTSIYAPARSQGISQERDSVEGRTQHQCRPCPNKFGY